jgi:hypothetical protein
MIPDYYDPRKVGELFLEDPARIAKAAPSTRGVGMPLSGPGQEVVSGLSGQSPRAYTAGTR